VNVFLGMAGLPRGLAEWRPKSWLRFDFLLRLSALILVLRFLWIILVDRSELALEMALRDSFPWR